MAAGSASPRCLQRPEERYIIAARAQRLHARLSYMNLAAALLDCLLALVTTRQKIVCIQWRRNGLVASDF